MTKTRARRKIMLERFDLRGRAFRERFHAPVGKILHISDNLVPRRRALRKETITNALNIAADQKSPRNFTRVC